MKIRGNHIIVAHSNSLRAIIKILDNLSDQEIMSVNIPTGIPLVYTFNQNKIINKKYLINEKELIKKQQIIENQGKKSEIKVVGDLMLDAYVYDKKNRKSPEADVPIVLEENIILSLEI